MIAAMMQRGVVNFNDPPGSARLPGCGQAAKKGK